MTNTQDVIIIHMIRMIVFHAVTSACGRHPDTTMLGLNRSISKALSILELSSSKDASDASNTGEKSAKLVCGVLR